MKQVSFIIYLFMHIFNKKSKYPERVKDLEMIKSVFDKHGVKFLVVYGALLGMYRDKDFIAHDDDIDLAVIDSIDLKTRKAIGWALYDLGFKPQPILFNVFGRMEPSEIGYNGDQDSGIIVCERNFKFTIFFFKPELCHQHDFLEFICVPKLGAVRLIASPHVFYKKLDSIKINGKKYLTPSPIEKYLEFTYLNKWKDKNDRTHGLTYFEMHPEQIEQLNLEGKNQAMILK